MKKSKPRETKYLAQGLKSVFSPNLIFPDEYVCAFPKHLKEVRVCEPETQSKKRE